jgi:hypothetical protein
MVKKITVVLIGSALLFGLWLYFHRQEPGPRLVSAIEVEYGSSRQIYEDPGQMSRILNRLRSLGQRYAPDLDPETLSGPTVSIRIHHSDGTSQQYQIKPDRYVRTGQATWQQADPKQIQLLLLLLKKSNAPY